MEWLFLIALLIVAVIEIILNKYKREIWESIIFPKDDE